MTQNRVTLRKKPKSIGLYTVSVVVPVYNVSDYIDKCLETIINQDYKNLEILLIDDGSTDKSGELCDKWAKIDSRIKVYHNANMGLSGARNFGVRQSSGDFITFIDSDDFIDLDYVSYLMNLVNIYGTKIAIAQHRVLFPNGRISDNGLSTPDELLNAHDVMERILYHDVIDTSAWGKLFHQSLFDTDIFPVGKLFEDIGSIYKLICKTNSIAIGYQSKYNYIMRSKSIVNSKYNINKMDLLEMTDEMGRNVQEKFPDLKDAVLRRRVYARISTYNQMINENDFYDSKQELLNFILENGGCILRNPRVSLRDKVAIRLLKFNPKLYTYIWRKYVEIKKGQ